MSEGTQTQNGTTTTTTAPAPNGAGGQAAGAGGAGDAGGQGATVSMTSDQLKARFDEERSKGERNATTRVLKELGFDKLDDAKAVIKAAKDLETAALSEKDKLAKALEDLKPKAQRAEVLEPLLASMVEEQFAALPETVRNAIDEQAKGNVERRLELMQVMRKAGLVGGAQSSASTQQQTQTAPPATRGGSPPPPPSGARTKFQEWQALEKGGNQVRADLFYQHNRQEIERTRPADQ